MTRFIRIFYEEAPPHTYTKWWHGRAYYSFRKNRLVMVMYPFHWAVNFAWWLNWKWAEHRHRESWIDRQLSNGRERDVRTNRRDHWDVDDWLAMLTAICRPSHNSKRGTDSKSAAKPPRTST